MSAAVGLGLYAAALLPELPTIEEIRRVPLNIPLRIYNHEQQLIAEYGSERRIPVSLDKTPQLLIDAVLATEDHGFYNHNGVDFRGLVRALWHNLRSKSRAQGASTITMQVARNFFLTPKKTYTRKLKEILLAFNMERALTKDEILELYLNKIFLGHRAYGFAAAAQIYYGVALEDLSIPEIAMLAGLPKAPSRDNPISNPKRADERRNYVLKRMHSLGWIDQLSYQTARLAPITATGHLAKTKNDAPYVAEIARQMMHDNFGERVYELGYKVFVTVRGKHQTRADKALRKGLLDYDRRHGFRGAVARIDLDDYVLDAAKGAPALDAAGESRASIDSVLAQYPKSGEFQPAVALKVGPRAIHARTQTGENIRIPWSQIEQTKPYLRPNAVGKTPTAASQVAQPGDILYVSQTMSASGERVWRLDQLPEVSGALVSLDPNSGAIIAISGGFDYYLSKFNRATQALRQPGSNIKPFIYSAALEHGFTPASLVSAAPIVIEDPLEGVWRPQNYSKKFPGPMRLREALSRSVNLVAVRLVRAIGIDATIDHLVKFGFRRSRLPRSFSLALGSASMTPLEVAAGFAVFANGGRRVKPYLIERIVEASGAQVTLSADECEYCKPAAVGATATELVAIEAPRAISAANAFLMRDLLQQVILTGTGRRALALKRGDLSGKTGTTNNFRDAWFSGFTQDLVSTVFVGFDEPSHLGYRESGAAAALPIWIDYMRAALRDHPEQPSIPPPAITTRHINRATGLLTYPDDPDGYWEYYLAGSEPQATSPPPGQKTKSEGLF